MKSSLGSLVRIVLGFNRKTALKFELELKSLSIEVMFHNFLSAI